MSKRLLAIISAICILCSLASCGNSEDSDTLEISETESSSSELTSSEDSSSEYIVDSSEDESSEIDSSETDSSEDESSEIEKVTTKTPKKVENSSSEDDNSSKVTTTKKTETSKTTTTTKTTQAPVTQKPTTTTKTTTKKPVTQPNGSHTHNWVKYREADGIKYYQCTICFELKEEGKKTTTTTKVQPTSKTIQSNEWIPVYNKMVVANCVADGYDKKTSKHLDWISPTYWDVKALSRGEAKAQADYKKANDEALAWCYTVNAGGWTQGGNDHPINTPDKSSIAFWYYRDSNGKLAIQFPISPNQRYSGIKTEADLKTYGCYDNVSRIGTPGLGYDTVYYIGTPWAK